MSLSTAPAGKQEGMMLPPPARPSKRRKLVIEEDEYVSQLEAILERDFFPDLPKLKNKLEWAAAINSGDINLIRQAQINIAKRRAGMQTPMATGQTPAMTTPHTALFRTPAMTPLHRGDDTAGTEAAADVAQQQHEQPQPQSELKAPNMTLDEFLSNFTSEDNASFEQLQEDAARRKELKYAHHLREREPALLLTQGRSTDEYGSSGQPQWSLVPWKFNPRNTHFFGASNREELALTVKEAAERAQGAPKAIVHRNTCLPPASDADLLQQAAPQQQQQQQHGPPGAAAAAAAAGLPGALADLHPQGVPGTQGYDYMPTPSLAPGVEESPFMTWGMLGSTPLRLDADDDLRLDLQDGSGPSFKICQPTAREQAAQLLAQKAAARQKTGAKTPLLPPSGGLSVAGKKLASVLRGGKATGTVDSQLRSSYTPQGSRGSAHSTPRLGSVRGTPKVRGTPLHSAAAGGAGAVEATAGTAAVGGNVTDGLLHL